RPRRAGEDEGEPPALDRRAVERDAAAKERQARDEVARRVVDDAAERLRAVVPEREPPCRAAAARQLESVRADGECSVAFFGFDAVPLARAPRRKPALLATAHAFDHEIGRMRGRRADEAAPALVGRAGGRGGNALQPDRSDAEDEIAGAHSRRRLVW